MGGLGNLRQRPLFYSLASALKFIGRANAAVWQFAPLVMAISGKHKRMTMQTIHLEPNMIPAALRGGYTGKKFKAVVTTEVTIPSDAGIWSGGSRETYSVIELATGRSVQAVDHNAAPWNGSRRDIPVKLEPGIAVVRHSMFCGKDTGLTFYVHPDNAAKLLPAPAAELSVLELLVLQYTAWRKSSYMGRDRYDMALDDGLHGYSDNPARLMPTRDEWNAAKAALASRGLLNKAGAITPAGRNAIPSRY